MDDLKPYPAYKDSGVPWLGDVPEHWGMERLDRLFTLRKEEPLDNDQRVTAYLDGRVTLRSNVQGQKIKGVVKETGWQRIHPGDFAISGMNAHLGGMGVSDSLGKCSPIYLILSPKASTNAHFISLAVRYLAHTNALKSLVNTIRFNSADFKRDHLKLLQVWLPEPTEQLAIVKYLDYVDRRVRRYIRVKQKLIKLLEEQKQAIIHQAVTRGLDSHAPLKPSGIDWLGDIPTHWNIISVGAATSLLQTGPFGSQLHSYEYVTGGTPVINPSHMKDGRIVPDSTVSVSTLKLRELERHRMCVGDIVAARRGELGRCALITLVEEGWLCGTGSLLIRCKPSILQYLRQFRVSNIWIGGHESYPSQKFD